MTRISANDRRDTLISAATRVIAEHGIADATTRRIAAEAKAPLATLHYCFHTKDELFAAVLRQPYDAFQSEFQEIAEGEGLSSSMAKIMRGMLTWVLAHEAFQTAQFEVMLWSLHRERDLAVTTFDGYFEINEKALRHGCAPGEDPSVIPALARLAAATIDGMVIQHLCAQDRERVWSDFEILIEAMATHVERLVKPSSAS